MIEKNIKIQHLEAQWFDKDLRKSVGPLKSLNGNITVK